MKRVYGQSRNDDGGYASRGLAALGDFAAVRPRSEFVEVLRPEAQSQPDVQTIRRGSMTSVPAVPPHFATDTRPVSGVHPLSVDTLLAPQAENRRGAPREMFISLDDLSALGLPQPFFPAPHPTVTYVVRRQGWIKIGKTRGSVDARLKTLGRIAPGVRCPPGMDMTAPLQLLVTIERDVEQVLHERYAAHHAAGEWFVADDAMLSEIAAMAEGRAA